MILFWGEDLHCPIAFASSNFDLDVCTSKSFPFVSFLSSSISASPGRAS